MNDNDYISLELSRQRLASAMVDLRENHVISAWEKLDKSIKAINTILDHEKRPTMCEQGRKTDE